METAVLVTLAAMAGIRHLDAECHHVVNPTAAGGSNDRATGKGGDARNLCCDGHYRRHLVDVASQGR